MWYPYQAISQETVKLFIAALNNDEVKTTQADKDLSLIDEF